MWRLWPGPGAAAPKKRFSLDSEILKTQAWDSFFSRLSFYVTFKLQKKEKALTSEQIFYIFLLIF